MLEALIDEPDFEWLMIDVGYVKVHAHGTGAVRLNNGRKEQTSLRVLDSQSVKNTNSAESNGYDAGKRISGIKRHIAVDTQGLPTCYPRDYG